MQDETVLVFQQTHLDAQFHRNPRFTLADPFGVRFKQREHLFGMGNLFIQNYTAFCLIDLTFGMGHERFNFQFPHHIQLAGASPLHQQTQRAFGLVQIALDEIEIVLMRCDDQDFVLCLLLV